MHSCEEACPQFSMETCAILTSVVQYSFFPHKPQIVLFSATFPDKVYTFATTFAPGSNEIRLRHEELTVEGIKQLYMDCSNEEEKYMNLVQLYGLLTVGSSIIFVRVCIDAVYQHIDANSF